MQAPMPPPVAASLALLAAVTLSGCNSMRSDKITFAAGNAMQHNRAVHTINPWAKHAFDVDIPGDGVRTARIIALYLNGETPTTEEPSPATTEPPAATGEQGV